MRLARSLPLLPLVALACAPAPPAGPPPSTSQAASVSVQQVAAPVPPSPPDSSPTPRTDEQKARDLGRAPLAKAILDAYANSSPEFSPDRKKVLFASRRAGNRQFYLADVAKPSDPPVELTHGHERAAEARFSRDGRSVLFLRDTGVDENFRIFQVGLDGQAETCLTPGPARRRSLPIEPRARPGTLVYTQRDVASAATDVVVQVPGGEPKVVYTDPSFSSLHAVTADGTRALLRRPENRIEFLTRVARFLEDHAK
jgi:dipeptidyl aminopeptidase/acylaminoacyl peptidase